MKAILTYFLPLCFLSASAAMGDGFTYGAAEPQPPPAAPAPPPQPQPQQEQAPGSGYSQVSQDQYQQLLGAYRDTARRVNRLEAELRNQKTGGSGDAKSGEEVDLGAPLPSSKTTNEPSASPHGSSDSLLGNPNFRAYFDLNLVDMPNVYDLSFTNYHSLLLFEATPSPDVSFSFQVSSTPYYYELDLQALPSLQFRLGKIWIPFDDLGPHNIFGGRIDVSRLAPGPNVFLPDIWAELGAGIRWVPVDRKSFQLETNLYVTNGFGSGGVDPTGDGHNYPSFADSSTLSTDNNRDKAIGGRIHALWDRKFGAGFSYYTCRWNDETDLPDQRLSIYGLDAQLRLNQTEFRTGWSVMNVGIAPDASGNTNFLRGGYYDEISQRFGRKSEWKGLLRYGSIQLDDRVVDASTMNLVGATLLYKPNYIEYSIETSHDLKMVASKSNYSYTALRVIIAL